MNQQSPVEKVIKYCWNRHSCPYLNFEDPEKVLMERDYLRERVNQLEATCEVGIRVLQIKDQEIAGLKEEIASLKRQANQEREKIYKPAKKEKNSHSKPGAPVGHRGSTREKPKNPDKTVHVHLKECPHCKGEVKRISGENSFSDHIQEDIIIIKTVTLFRHYKYWCPKCKKVVSGIGEGEIPRSYIGPNAVVISNLGHYDIGIPYNKLKRFYRDIFGLPITTGALIGIDKKVAEGGISFYSQLEEKIKNSSVSYTDETGWPINGEQHWLWHAGNKEVSLYRIDEHRNHFVAEEILGKDYKGVIVSDCLSSYNLVNANAKQKCIAHLLRDLENLINLNSSNPEVVNFSVNIENILREGLEIKKEYEKGKYNQKDLERMKEQLENKIAAITDVKLTNKRAESMRKRLIRHKNELFTFLSHPEVEPTNNFAERQLRPSVISRKLSFGNKTKEGANRHAVMMSLIQTAKLQGKNPKDLLFSLILGSRKIRTPT